MRIYRCTSRFFCTPLKRYIPEGAVVYRYERTTKLAIDFAPDSAADPFHTRVTDWEYNDVALVTWFDSDEVKARHFQFISSLEDDPAGGGTGDMTYRGDIAVNADFPAANDRGNGDFFRVVGAVVDPVTGEAFSAGTYIVWDEPANRYRVSAAGGGGAQGPQGPQGVQGAGTVYSNAAPTPETIGGIEAGSTFANRTMQQMWDDLLYPYQYPAFTAFSISGQADTLEVGDSIPAAVTFLWATSNPANIAANSISIADVTGSATLASGLADDGSEPVNMGSPVTKTSQASNTFRITGTNTQSGTFSRDKTYNWRWRVYWGTSATSPLVEVDIEGLASSALSGGFAATYSFAASPGEYKYLCYPAVMGTATAFTDVDTGFSVPFEAPYLVSVTNAYGESTDYRVHRSTNMLGGAMNIAAS